MKKILVLSFSVLCLFAKTYAQTIPSYIPSDSLIGWWPFNGNANDESGNGNSGAVSGATLTTDRFGNPNKAYDFNGSSMIQTVISSAYAPSTSDSYSITFWFRGGPNPPSSSKMAMQYKTGSGTGPNISNYDVFSHHTNCGSGAFAVQNYPFNNPSACSPDTVETGTWTHIYILFDQIVDSVKVYKNSHFWFKGAISSSTPTEGTLTFGNNSDGTSLFGFNGKLDDIAVWNRALTVQEISNLYTSNLCFQSISVTDTLIINTSITGFHPVTYGNSIKIFPNPSHDHITIDNGNFTNLAGHQIKISNAIGQQVFQSAINQQQFYIDLATWSGNGLYFVNIINPQGVTIETRKIVLQ